ncbi:MAG: TlyA family RNA methyltransferase [Candidatus Coatesbacteria bacterium]|nr:MAG: TlyA family RNA methyltransferase [Candidatus Coatesbacteria bacterium]
MARRRLDEVVVERDLAPSREKAAALIMAGRVRVDGEVVTKAGAAVAEEASVTVTGGPAYASRGGEKLAAALEAFGVVAAGRVALDVGASTGGFTSCLLARGASHVHALDVGRGLLAWELRVDSRVTMWEGVNARNFDGGVLEPAPALAVVDVSFIGLAKVLRPLVPTLPALEEIVALVKPQFEARRSQVERGGVVRDPKIHRKVVSAAAALLDELDFAAVAVARSPLEGPAGNYEFFLCGRRGAARRELGAEISRAAGFDNN